MFPTTTTTTAELASMFDNSQVDAVNTGGGKAFLKFDFQSGNWTSGAQSEDVSEQEVMVNATSFRHGYTLWSGGSPTKVSAPFNEPLPTPPAAIGDDTPSESREVEARFMDDDGILSFGTSSYGGRKGVDALLFAIQNRARAGAGAYLFPLVKLTSESYKAKTGKVINNPVFEILGWANQDGVMEGEIRSIEGEPEKRTRNT